MRNKKNLLRAIHPLRSRSSRELPNVRKIAKLKNHGRSNEEATQRIGISWSLMRLPPPRLLHGLDLAPCKKPEIQSDDSCPAYLTLLSGSEICETLTTRKQHHASLSSQTHLGKHIVASAQRSPCSGHLTETCNKHRATTG